jgi:hypothetical protein
MPVFVGRREGGAGEEWGKGDRREVGGGGGEGGRDGGREREKEKIERSVDDRESERHQREGRVREREDYALDWMDTCITGGGVTCRVCERLYVSKLLCLRVCVAPAIHTIHRARRSTRAVE